MLLISKEWRDSGWGNFICSEKQKQMGNVILRKRRGGCRGQKTPLRVKGVQEKVKNSHILLKKKESVNQNKLPMTCR